MYLLAVYVRTVSVILSWSLLTFTEKDSFRYTCSTITYDDDDDGGGDDDDVK